MLEVQAVTRPQGRRPLLPTQAALTANANRMMPSSKDESTVVTDASASSLSSSSIRAVFESGTHKGAYHELEARRNHDRNVGEISRAAIEKLGTLGFGSFSDVFEVRVVRGCIRGVLGLDPDKTYAAKMLRRSPAAGTRCCYADGGTNRLAHAAKDLAEEAALLSRLPRHDHVIALQALSDDFFTTPSEGFLLLERLTGTLQDSLERWRSDAKQQAASKSPSGCRSLFGMSAKAKAKRDSLARSETSRGTGIGIPLAKALEFLHRNNVIFRDISPSNVGFDGSGTLKLFDFGTARSCAADRAMTMFTGTPRYMSPEVMVGSGGSSYGLPADVYSFSVVLWEVSTTTLQKPYALIRDLDAAKRSIAKLQYRPPLHQVSDRRLRGLIKSGWDPDPRSRPTFLSIVVELDRIQSVVATA